MRAKRRSCLVNPRYGLSSIVLRTVRLDDRAATLNLDGFLTRLNLCEMCHCLGQDLGLTRDRVVDMH